MMDYKEIHKKDLEELLYYIDTHVQSFGNTRARFYLTVTRLASENRRLEDMCKFYEDDISGKSAKIADLETELAEAKRLADEYHGQQDIYASAWKQRENRARILLQTVYHAIKFSSEKGTLPSSFSSQICEGLDEFFGSLIGTDTKGETVEN